MQPYNLPFNTQTKRSYYTTRSLNYTMIFQSSSFFPEGKKTSNLYCDSSSEVMNSVIRFNFSTLFASNVYIDRQVVSTSYILCSLINLFTVFDKTLILKLDMTCITWSYKLRIQGMASLETFLLSDTIEMADESDYIILIFEQC